MTDTTKTKDETPIDQPPCSECGSTEHTLGSHEGNVPVSPMGSHEGNSAPTGTTT